MASIPDAGSSTVHTGFWMDYDNGRFLTLTDRNAAALLSILAVAVTFAANRSWKLFRFTLYRLHSSDEKDSHKTPKSTRELRVVLRNVLTAGSTIWTCLELLWIRRQPLKNSDSLGPVSSSHQHHRNWRSLTLALIAVVHFIVFIAAGILTSRVLVGQEVISRNTTTCGQWQPKENKEPVLAQTLTWQSLRLNETQDADNYVRNCYGLGVSRGILDCGKLHVRSLPYQVEHHVTCPFGNDLCSERPNGAFAMDSGAIPFRDLGINSKFGKHLSVQRRSICAVVPDEPFLDNVINGTSGTELSRSYTFYIQEGLGGFLYANDVISGTYSLRAHHLAFPPAAIPEPIRPSEPDHDPSVILLRSNGVQFMEESDDPWFSVHTRVNTSVDITPIYNADHFLNVVACKEAVRFCSDITKNCSPWRGLISSLSNLTDTIKILGGPGIHNGTADYQEIVDVFSLVGLATSLTSLPNSIQNRPATSALQAARWLQTTMQFYLEPEQWKIELEYWFAVAMARLQLEIFNTIEKPPGVNLTQAINSWQGTGLQSLCGRVKFHSPKHTTLSAVGIAVVVAVVVILTLASLVDVFLSWIPFVWAKRIVSDWEKLENLQLLTELESWWNEIDHATDPLQVHVETK